MRAIVLIAVLAACSGSQRAGELAAAECTGAELGQLAAIWSSAAPVAVKALETTPILLACAQQAASASAGSGSAK